MTRVLIDTHAFLWFVADDPRLSPRARQAMTGAQEALLSLASCWEMAVKASMGKLTLSQPVDRFLPTHIAENSLTLLHLELAHVTRVARLPWHHRDPFDRVLAAQALDEDLPIVSADPVFRRYGVKRIW